MTELEPPRDVRGEVIEVGDLIAYPKQSPGGSDGSEIVLARVLEVYDGQDRWRKPCRCLKVKPEVSSERLMSELTRRLWMTRKTVIIAKGAGT